MQMKTATTAITKRVTPKDPLTQISVSNAVLLSLAPKSSQLLQLQLLALHTFSDLPESLALRGQLGVARFLLLEVLQPLLLGN